MSVNFRRGTPDDTYSLFLVFQETIIDLGRRMGTMAITGGNDPAVMQKLWEERRPLFEHLERTSYQLWVAEQDGSIIGYAQSILREDVRQLTEFFVLPGRQSAGVGRELLSRAFPAEGARHRVVVATTDTRAIARYLKQKVYPRTPIYYFSRTPEDVSLESDLTFEPVSPIANNLAAIRAVDRFVLGYGRDVGHVWLAATRQGYLYKRGEQIAGYGYTGRSNGPFALLNAEDYPAVLAHAEKLAAAAGHNFGVEVPLINTHAVDHLLGRGCQIDAFLAFFMSDEPCGSYQNYIFTSPPFFS